MPVVAVAAPVLSAQFYRVFTGPVSSQHRGAGGATPSTSLRRSSQPAAAICARRHGRPRDPTSRGMATVLRALNASSLDLRWVSSDEQSWVNSRERQGLLIAASCPAPSSAWLLIATAVSAFDIRCAALNPSTMNRSAVHDTSCRLAPPLWLRSHRRPYGLSRAEVWNSPEKSGNGLATAEAKKKHLVPLKR